MSTAAHGAGAVASSAGREPQRVGQEEAPGSPRFPLLFSPLQVGSQTTANRIMMPAHTTGYARNGSFSDQLVAYYRERASGGAGIIVTEPNYVTPAHGRLRSVDDSIVTWYERLAAVCADNGSLVLAQLSHPGRQGSYVGEGAPLHVAPSAVPVRRFGQEWRIPRALDSREIAGIVDQFEAAANRAQRGGLHGVELHFAHGNLVDQFIMPQTNTRADEWGGDLQGRMKLALTIVEAVRNRVGAEPVIGVRITGPGSQAIGLTNMEVLEVAGTLDACGMIDYLSVSVGHYSDILATAHNIPDMTFPPAVWRHRLHEVAKIVDVPVAICGRINHPAIAEEMLKAGDCEIVAMARALIADPELPRKSQAGHAGQIRPCVGAVESCWGNVYSGRPMRCVHNPVVGRELEWDGELRPGARGRRVAVVGAGPAGLEAARAASLLGHDVVVFEKEDHVGGQLTLAARAPYRSELGAITDWLFEECRRSGAEFRLGTEVGEATLAAEDFDALVVATGALDSAAADVSAEWSDAVSAWDVLAGRVAPRGRVVLYDQAGQRLGLSTAEVLAACGAEVEIVTPMTFVGQGVPPFEWRIAYQRILELGATSRCLTDIRKVASGCVDVVHTISGAVETVEADAVVLALLPRANDRLYHRLLERFPRVYLVGDAVAPRGIEHATFDGHAVARTL